MSHEKLELPGRSDTELKFLQGLSRHGQLVADLFERIPNEAFGSETYQQIYTWLRQWVNLCHLQKDPPSFSRFVRGKFPGEGDDPIVLLACSLHQTPWEPYEVRHAAGKIEEWHAKDRAMAVAHRFQQRLLSQPLEKVLQLSQEEFDQIQAPREHDGITLGEAWGPQGKYMAELRENVAHFRKYGKPRREGVMKTGFAQWDEFGGGLQRKRMVVLGGRPACGKTTLSTWLGLQAAKEHKVLMVTLEMSEAEATLKAVAALANVSTHLIADGRVTDDQIEAIDEVQNSPQSQNFEVLEPLSMDMTSIRRAALDYMRRRGGLDVLIVDYLQIVKCSPTDRQQPRHVQVGNISTALKRLARELNVCVVIPAQLGRQSVVRSMPELVDLKESGSIEQDADQVILLDRVRDRVVGATDERAMYDDYLAMLMKKNRMGPTLTMIVKVNWSTGAIYDADPDHQSYCSQLYGYAQKREDADYVIEEISKEKNRKRYVRGYGSQ